MPPPTGWPTLADVHREVTATRADIRQLCAELAEQRRDLTEHRADDRRELDGLWGRTERLAGRERWLAGGLAAVGLLLTVGAPVALVLMT